MTAKPLVGIITNETVGFNGRQIAHSTGKRYVDSVMQFAGVMPILIPTCITTQDVGALLDHLDGIVLTGGRANVEPQHYGGAAFPADEPIDPDRDKIVLDLIPACVKRQMPIFGICRGIQEINVSFGGSLFYRVHQQAGMDDHRMPQNEDAPVEEIFRPRHPIHFTKNSQLRDLVDAETFVVNSLHGQGIKDLAPGLTVDAYSDDRVIEAISIDEYQSFGIGIQWHAEFHPERAENLLNKRLFEEFGKACLAYQRGHAGS